ncbi:MAG TPA: L-asparaginase [Micromonosporaceae bacterium]|nr:L-asparaginase [Micromonosporaceae bacterium]
MKPEPRPRVVLFALGGTIAMSAGAQGGVVPALSAAQLLAAIPGLTESAIDLEVNDFRKLPGASLSFDDLHELSAAIRASLEGGADGVVVTQGTDTIEETAYLLDLLHRLPQPVVVTGAMRNPTLAGADGPANLLAAIQVAADPGCRSQGALVVFADEIHAAKRVRKTHSTSGSTFQSANGGPLGYVVAGKPVMLSRLTTRFTLPTPPPDAPSPRIAVVVMSLGDDGVLLEGLAGRLDGLVVAGFGAGHVPEWTVPALHSLGQSMPVVLASRTAGGPVLTSTYGFPGSERDLISKGLIPAGFLDPYKARVLLRCALSLRTDTPTIAAAFAAAGGYAAPETWPWPAEEG